tara:strand:- start:524 stop:772 length:249 start_codon:yes stop_codon:yes gene_type:complete
MSYLPKELIDKINFYSYGPYNVETYNLKKEVNRIIKSFNEEKIWLTIMDENDIVSKELEYNNDEWLFDYTIAQRIPKLDPVN